MINTLKRYPITSLLVGSISLIFLLMQLLYPGMTETPQVIYQFGGLVGDILKTNYQESWRLITPIFVHIGWQHFLFNTITLFFLGKLLEDLYGHFRYLILFLFSGILGNIFVFVFTPNVIVAGASTAIFGLFAAVVVAGQNSRYTYLKQLSNSYRILILINLVFNLITPNVSIVGHLGGLTGGVLLGVALSKTDNSYFKTSQKLATTLLYSLIFIGLLTIPWLF
ncbi:rhomboid family intramembrane serine protease [Streptococcus hyovaginalis]